MDRTRLGFTIVEMAIVIALIGILLALAVVRLSSSQAQARDNALHSDAVALSRSLEDYYRNGYPVYSIGAGKYPSSDEFRHASGENVPAIGAQMSGGYLDTWLNGVRLPVTSRMRLINLGGSPENGTNVSNSTPTGVITYEPLRYNGSAWVFCTGKSDQCTRYNLYYRYETDSAIVQTLRSERQ